MTETSTKLYQSIHAQPEAVRLLLADEASIAQIAERLHNAGRIFLTGIGTSFHAAIVGEYLLRLAGAEAWAVRSFEFVNYPRPLRQNDCVIVISHRGSKQYSAQAIERAVAAGVFTVGITGKGSKMQGAGAVLETVAQDPSSAHSISYIGALTRLGQLAVYLATPGGHAALSRQLAQELARIPTFMESILQREDEVRAVAQEAVRRQRRIYFIGAGPNAATAPEGALKAKESAYVTAEGFELEQALHGPLVAFEQNDLIVPICVPGAAQRRMADLLRALKELETAVWLLGEAPDAESATFFPAPHRARFTLTGEETLLEALTPMLAALPVQLLANFLAETRGTNADSFRLDQPAYQRANARFSL